ncbi:hypothetical protein FACS1894147_09300 [Spirochaetia bacterium]|nr:hypothetical protein FACS1894147_09300 [Spirochaetia bacterium]
MEVPVKKILCLMALCLAFLAVTPLFSQTISDEHKSKYFYVNVPIMKIFTYRKGYVVEYQKGAAQRARVYLPNEWFAVPTGPIAERVPAKGEYISLRPGTAWPYLTVYYENGEFSHVRVYARRDLHHETWGTIPQNVDLDQYFENVTDIKLEH